MSPIISFWYHTTAGRGPCGRPLATGIILCILLLVAVMFLFDRPLATGIILCILPLVAVVFLFGGRPRGPHPAVVSNPTGCLYV